MVFSSFEFQPLPEMDAEKAKHLQKAYQGVKQAVNLVEAMETETKKDVIKDSYPKSGDNRPLDEGNDLLLVLSQNEVEKQKTDLEMAENDKKALKKELEEQRARADELQSQLGEVPEVDASSKVESKTATSSSPADIAKIGSLTKQLEEAILVKNSRMDPGRNPREGNLEG